jgi:hypothetical protein
VCANTGDGASDAVGIGNRIVDRVTQFTEQVLQVIV